MAYTFVSGKMGLPAITSINTTRPDAVQFGERQRAFDPDYGEGEFIYLKGGSNIAAGSWVTFSTDDWTCAALAANAIGPVGIAMAALDAATDFGWVQVYGKVQGALCLTSFADNGLVFATASVGYVDDASVAGDLVNRAKGASTSTARSADFEIEYPFVNDNSNSGA